MMIGMPIASFTRLEMLVHAFLGWLVVIGRDHENGVGASLFRMTGQGDRLGRGVRSRTCYYRHATTCLIHAPFHYLVVLVVRQCGTFAW